jgi:hypothetical protein
MGIGDWGLGIGDWGLGPIPNPQSPCLSNKNQKYIKIKIIISIIIKKQKKLN